ncbi:hypothetical protein INT43_009000 [Umbelopsis isabellina]|uniref:Transmembrane protein n=1 Tax=Mortierella isabellina TaxID=91625 RepID=A0A8H7UH14_MORIS|nr:hypothetical protein INT43_009000 [Umbelopsis isabellina]
MQQEHRACYRFATANVARDDVLFLGGIEFIWWSRNTIFSKITDMNNYSLLRRPGFRILAILVILLDLGLGFLPTLLSIAFPATQTVSVGESASTPPNISPYVTMLGIAPADRSSLTNADKGNLNRIDSAICSRLPDCSNGATESGVQGNRAPVPAIAISPVWYDKAQPERGTGWRFAAQTPPATFGTGNLTSLSWLTEGGGSFTFEKYYVTGGNVDQQGLLPSFLIGIRPALNNTAVYTGLLPPAIETATTMATTLGGTTGWTNRLSAITSSVVLDEMTHVLLTNMTVSRLQIPNSNLFDQISKLEGVGASTCVNLTTIMPGEQRFQNTTITGQLAGGSAAIGISYLAYNDYSVLTSCQLQIVSGVINVLVNEYWAWDITLGSSLLSPLVPTEGPNSMSYASRYLKNQSGASNVSSTTLFDELNTLSYGTGIPGDDGHHLTDDDTTRQLLLDQLSTLPTYLFTSVQDGRVVITGNYVTVATMVVFTAAFAVTLGVTGLLGIVSVCILLRVDKKWRKPSEVVVGAACLETNGRSKLNIPYRFELMPAGSHQDVAVVINGESITSAQSLSFVSNRIVSNSMMSNRKVVEEENLIHGWPATPQELELTQKPYEQNPHMAQKPYEDSTP